VGKVGLGEGRPVVHASKEEAACGLTSPARNPAPGRVFGGARVRTKRGKALARCRTSLEGQAHVAGDAAQN